jgi:transketolase
MKRELLDYSYKQQLSHIASSLSMIDYLDVLFTEQVVVPYRDHIIIGKPFGAQAYYLVWKKLGYLDNIESLNVGVKHDEIPFVDYSEETMGNALGVAAGIAMTTDKQVWVNISDAALQMGNTIEAIQFIGHHNIKNIFLTIDFNNAQVTGNTSDILKTSPLITLFKNYGWFTQQVNGHNKVELKKILKDNFVDTVPNVVFCHTEKGHGVYSMSNDIRKWHYKKIETEAELQQLILELK